MLHPQTIASWSDKFSYASLSARIVFFCPLPRNAYKTGKIPPKNGTRSGRSQTRIKSRLRGNCTRNTFHGTRALLGTWNSGGDVPATRQISFEYFTGRRDAGGVVHAGVSMHKISRHILGHSRGEWDRGRCEGRKKERARWKWNSARRKTREKVKPAKETLEWRKK